MGGTKRVLPWSECSSRRSEYDELLGRQAGQLQATALTRWETASEVPDGQDAEWSGALHLGQETYLLREETPGLMAIQGLSRADLRDVLGDAKRRAAGVEASIQVAGKIVRFNAATLQELEPSPILPNEEDVVFDLAAATQETTKETPVNDLAVAYTYKDALGSIEILDSSGELFVRFINRD